jgi:hypothetical protein
MTPHGTSGESFPVFGNDAKYVDRQDMFDKPRHVTPANIPFDLSVDALRSERQPGRHEMTAAEQSMLGKVATKREQPAHRMES